MGGRIAATLLIISSAVWGAPYQKITAEIPPYLPQGVKDSTLIAWGPPVAARPAKTAHENIDPVIWMRIKVGEKGRAVSCEIVHSSHPGYGLEDVAKDAVKSGLYYAAWDGPSPVEYTGYYPVTFASLTYGVVAPAPHPGFIGFLGIRSVSGRGAFVFGPDGPADWKSLREYVARDAPVVSSSMPLEIEWPKSSRQTIAEPTVWLKVEIDRKGRVKSSSPFFFLEDCSGFNEAAARAVRSGQYPVWSLNGYAREYTAYVAVDFRHDAADYTKLGYPEPGESTNIDQPPVQSFPTSISMPPIMARAGIEGSVRLLVLVDSTGTVLVSRVDSSSSFVELDRYAHLATSKMQFKPARLANSPVPAWTVMRLDFTRDQTQDGHLASPEAIERKEDTTNAAKDSSNSLPALGEFQPLERMPEVIKEGEPEYPRVAQMNRMQGKVIVWALIGKDGQVIECRISKTSGHRELDQAAAAALFKYVFKPGIQNGKPVKCWISKSFSFQMTDD